MGGQRNPDRPGKFGSVQQGRASCREKRHKTGHLGQPFDIGEIPDIAFQKRCDIGRKPGVPSVIARTFIGFRIASTNHRLYQLRPGKGGSGPVPDLARKTPSMIFRRVPVISWRDKGQRVRISIRPARDSEIFGRRRILADPVRRKRPGFRSRSTSAFMAKNRSGTRWTSSMMTFSSVERINSCGSFFAAAKIVASSKVK
jgi:hypothetical protein